MWSLRSFAAALYVSTENTSVMGLLLLFVCCCCVVDDLQRDWTLPRPKPWCQVLCCFCCWIVYVELEIFLSDIERFHGKHLGHGLAVVAGIIIFVQFYAANILLNFKSHTFFLIFCRREDINTHGKERRQKGPPNPPGVTMSRLEEIKALITREQGSEEICFITKKSCNNVLYPTKKN